MVDLLTHRCLSTAQQEFCQNQRFRDVDFAISYKTNKSLSCLGRDRSCCTQLILDALL